MPALPASRSGIHSMGSLAAAGVPTSCVRRLVETGELVRLRRGWYAQPTAESDAMSAVRAGGLLSGGRRLARAGGWVAPSAPLVVVVSAGARPEPRPRIEFRRRPRLSLGDHPDGLAPLPVALRHALDGLPVAESAAVADSLLHAAATGAMPHDDRLPAHRLVVELAHTSRGRRILALLDPDAESGLESVARVRLAEAGFAVRSQHLLPTRQRIDLVVEERIAVELDGATHIPREAFQRDRRKDALAAQQGLVPLRFSYHQVMNDWDGVVGAIRRMLARTAG